MIGIGEMTAAAVGVVAVLARAAGDRMASPRAGIRIGSGVPPRVVIVGRIVMTSVRARVLVAAIVAAGGARVVAMGKATRSRSQ